MESIFFKLFFFFLYLLFFDLEDWDEKKKKRMRKNVDICINGIRIHFHRFKDIWIVNCCEKVCMGVYTCKRTTTREFAHKSRLSFIYETNEWYSAYTYLHTLFNISRLFTFFFLNERERAGSKYLQSLFAVSLCQYSILFFFFFFFFFTLLFLYFYIFYLFYFFF